MAILLLFLAKGKLCGRGAILHTSEEKVNIEKILEEC